MDRAAQITLPLPLTEPLDRIPQHHARHPPVMPAQKLFLDRPVAFANLAQHPARRLVNQVFPVSQQMADHRHRRPELASSDEIKRRHDRHPPFPNRFRPAQPSQGRAASIPQISPENVFRRTIHQIPIVDVPAVPQIQLVDASSAVGIGAGKPVHEDYQRQQPFLMRGRPQQLFYLPQRHVPAGPCQSAHPRHGHPDEPVAFPVFARPRLEISTGDARPFSRRPTPQFSSRLRQCHGGHATRCRAPFSPLIFVIDCFRNTS